MKTPHRRRFILLNEIPWGSLTSLAYFPSPFLIKTPHRGRFLLLNEKP
jgi:hypothetical protein